MRATPKGKKIELDVIKLSPLNHGQSPWTTTNHYLGRYRSPPGGAAQRALPVREAQGGRAQNAGRRATCTVPVWRVGGGENRRPGGVRLEAKGRRGWTSTSW